ncbi:TRAP transporter fused permease subunit [Halorubrum sp. JWXQ-INN 858]|uniref:TRAP transporter permease n=1 Tax=Halorubrum sp. JWXQ-INN 858 TaxID=2690782 RepID=UPI001359839D|nr:TRAP transporter fused permease subunit [Halorubrum sp. JWXQ-INN 858]MWV65594.1 TRAP transporter fused permease subunit [Halorubrum sp. JWXQ-INN 858]
MTETRSRSVLTPAVAVDKLLTLLAVVLWALAIYYAYTQRMPRALYTVGLFGLAFGMYAINESIESFEENDYLDLYLLGVVLLTTSITSVYLIVNFEDLLFMRTGTAFHDEYVLALLFTLAMFYLIYRAFGMAFLAVIAGGALYAWLGASLPGLIGHGGLSLTRILNVFVMDFDGFFGSISGIVAAWVALFLLYAGLLNGYGAFDYIMRIAFRISEYVESGIAQSAVVASLAIGSINGAQVANAAMTGSVTIPLMKEAGMKSSTAGGIEAVASSGGQIMPPVMGAAAFIMASILGITYIEVVVAGIVPALVFYIAVAIAVHYAAINQDIKSGVNAQEEADIGDTKSRAEFLLETVKLAIPFAVLVYLLGVAQWTVMSAALYTAVAMFLTGITFPVLDRLLGYTDDPYTIGLSQTVSGMKYGALILAPIAVIVAAINGIVDILVTTGVPGKLALALMELSGGVLIIALLLAMLICIILGMGMPTVAAYTIVALLVAPALIEGFGLARLPVHFFVFYAAILSGITPPIAIAVVVTTGIAQSNFWATAIEAVKISAPLFVLPFAFIYNPEIIVGGLTLTKVVSSVLLLFGAAAMVHGLNYYKRAIPNRLGNYAVRLAFVVLGVAIMAVPSELVRFGATVLATLLFTWQIMTVREMDLAALQTAVTRRL